MKFYKVLDSDLTSARWGNVQYYVNEFVYAPCNSRLFIFNSFHAAKQFRFPDEGIWICEAQEVSVPKWLASNAKFTDQDFWDIVNNKRSKFPKRLRDYMDKVPYGTRWARAVKIIEKVD